MRRRELGELVRALNAISSELPLIFPAHPRTRPQLGRHDIDPRITVTEPLGNETLVFAEFDGKDWVSRMLNPKPLKAGEKVKLSLDLSQAHLFDAQTGKSLRA